MLQVVKRAQIFSPGSDFSLSSLSSGEKSMIESIWGQNSSGTIVRWGPSVVFPPIAILRKDKSYMIRSNLVSNAFVSYYLPIDPGGLPGHDESILNLLQFFTYRGDSNFALSLLSSSVKSRMARIYAEGTSSTSDFVNWTPTTVFPAFSSFVTGKTYLVESVSQGFTPYDLGVPDPPEESLFTFLNDALLPDIGLLPAEYVEA